MVIKYLSDSHFDVFWGLGWLNWARYEKKSGKVVSGEYPPHQIQSFINNKFFRK